MPCRWEDDGQDEDADIVRGGPNGMLGLRRTSVRAPRPDELWRALAPPPMNRDIVIVHSSDLHVDHDYTARLHGGDGTAGLACVLKAARGVGADLVLLAGDTFESHRVPQDVLDRAASVIADAGLSVVLLPGNHDPAIPEAIYRRGLLAAVGNLHVLGVTHEEAVDFPELGLEVWGRAHRDYGDMAPLATIRPRRTRWQVALAHGHYDPAADRSVFPAVLAHQRGDRGDRRRLRRARPLEPRRQGRQSASPPIIPARRNMPGPSTWCG